MRAKKQISLKQLRKKAQDTFNAYIRFRDNDKGCISCGGTIEHAGHYFSQGHHPALCFNEVNTNGQCCRCNRFLSGNLIKYRSGLVKRYGEPKVLHLEAVARRSGKKWTRVELLAIIDHYQKEINKFI